ncbi:MAG TPA: hypothetical protein VFO65_04520 [Acidimicrobiales bacterium]|nr:hypothetical protein [Acidimicrobiales bacterium]
MTAAPSLGPAAALAAAPPAVARRSMAGSSLGLVLGKSASLALGFVFWLVAARLAAPADVGLAAGAVAAMMLCVLVGGVGVGAAVIGCWPAHRDRPAPLLDAATTVVAAAATVTAGLFLAVTTAGTGSLAGLASSPAFGSVFVVLTVLGALGVLADQASMAMGRGDEVLVRSVTFGLLVLMPLSAFAGLGATPPVLALVGCWVGGGLGATALAAVQLRRGTGGWVFRPWAPTGARGGTVASLVRDGLPNHALTIAERAPGFLLPIVVTEVLTPEANAYWYSAWMMAWVVYTVPISVGIALFAEGAREPGLLASSTRRARRLSLALGGAAAVGLALVADVALGLLGPAYADAGTTPLRVLLLALVPMSALQGYYAVCRARRKLGEAVVTGAAALAAGVGAAAAVAPHRGLVGMAGAWVGVQAVAGAWASWRLRQVGVR